MKLKLAQDAFRPNDPMAYYLCLRTATLLHGYAPAPAGCILIPGELFDQCTRTLEVMGRKNGELIDHRYAIARN